MRFQATGCGWRLTRLMFVLLVQMPILAAVARADAVTELVTQGQTMFTYGEGEPWVKLTVATVDGTPILQKTMENGTAWLYIPNNTSLTLRVTCGTVPYAPNILSITVTGGVNTFVDTSGNTSVSWTTDPFNIGWGTGLQASVLFDSLVDPDFTLQCFFNVRRPIFYISANIPGDPENPRSGGGRLLDELTTNKDIFSLLS